MIPNETFKRLMPKEPIPIEPFRNVMPKELMIPIAAFTTVTATNHALPIDKFKICMSIELNKYQLRQQKKGICLKRTDDNP